MKTFELPCYGIIVTLTEVDPDKPELHLSGTITSDLKEACEFCGSKQCDMFCTDAQEHISDRDIEMQRRKEKELREKANYNNIIDGYESFILACACAGLDIGCAAFIEAIETTIENCANKV